MNRPSHSEDVSDDYDPTADFAASIDECYRAIRERVAGGGPGWGGWPTGVHGDTGGQGFAQQPRPRPDSFSPLAAEDRVAPLPVALHKPARNMNGHGLMIITIATLRAAGLTEAQILQVVEIADTQQVEKRRQQNREAARNYRARQQSQHDSADSADAADGERHISKKEEKKERKKVRKVSKTVMPDAWHPAIAPEDGAEFERFTNYCKANAKTYADWDAAWYNWRTSPYRNGRQGNGTLRPHPGPVESPITAAANRIRQKLGLVEDRNDHGRLSQGRLPQPGSVHDAGGDEPDEIPKGHHRVRECANNGYSDTIKMAAKHGRDR